jgi:superoxide dismutase, Cu-Zn family
MKLLNCASVLTALAVLSVPPIIAVDAAETAKAMLKDTKGQDVGSVSFLQTSAGVLLQLSLNGVPAGEHAFHIHAVGKCEPPGFDSAGGHFSPANTHHGMMSGPGHAGDMPNQPRSGKWGPRSGSAQRLDHPRQGQAQLSLSSWRYGDRDPRRKG